jgi:hypothetical protein
MATIVVKKHSTIGVCGLDCALCPRYYTKGKSKCDGCGSEYSYAAVGCKIFKCCVRDKNLETCAECSDFPCSTLKGIDESDSFTTHRKTIANLRFIRVFGLDEFLNQQAKKRDLLEQMLKEYNDGRSRSFYCVAATLLSLEALKDSLDLARRNVKEEGIKGGDQRNRARILKMHLKETALEENIDLSLRTTSRKKN